MVLKQVDGWYWPEYDKHCHTVVPHQVADLERVYPFVKRFTVAVQAGGNAGMWPAAMAKKFDTVYTFEPDPINFQCLGRNVDALNVIKMQAALGRLFDLVETFTPPREFSNAGAIQVRAGGAIPIIALDALPLRDCALLQLDIEGHELAALQGAARILDSFAPVVVTEEKGLGGVPEGAIAQFLSGFGYREVARVHRDRIYSVD